MRAVGKIDDRQLLFGSVLLGRHNLLAAVETVRTDVVTAVHFAGTGFDGRGRVGEEVVSTVIAALAGRFFVLLNSHFLIPHVGEKLTFVFEALARPSLHRARTHKSFKFSDMTIRVSANANACTHVERAIILIGKEIIKPYVRSTTPASHGPIP